jgi:tetratricopeptide (TPR) repeat protein
MRTGRGSQLAVNPLPSHRIPHGWRLVYRVSEDQGSGRIAAPQALGYNRPALDATAGFSSPHRRAPRTGAPGPTLCPVVCLALCLAACAGAPGGGALNDGDRALAAGDPGRAEALFRSVAEAPEVAPATNAAAKANLGVALARQGRWDEAAGALEAARDLSPAGPRAAEVLFDLGVAYRHLGRYEDARAAYERALTLAPADVEIAYNLGILYELYLNQPGPALAAYRRYVAGGGPEAARVSRWIEALEQRRPQGGNPP